MSNVHKCTQNIFFKIIFFTRFFEEKNNQIKNHSNSFYNYKQVINNIIEITIKLHII